VLLAFMELKFYRGGTQTQRNVIEELLRTS
jgi:hypothetical protein